MIGYSTYYTMAPVFSLCLDEALSESTVFIYPELYETLREGRLMSKKVFFQWVFKSVFQGGAIMLLAMLLFPREFMDVVDITFTALVLSELLNVASEIHKWHKLMVVGETVTVVIYGYAVLILR